MKQTSRKGTNILLKLMKDTKNSKYKNASKSISVQIKCSKLILLNGTDAQYYTIQARHIKNRLLDNTYTSYNKKQYPQDLTIRASNSRLLPTILIILFLTFSPV